MTAAATAGTPQSTAIATSFGTALQVRVTHLGLPVAGAAVRFTAPASGASATFPGSIPARTPRSCKARAEAPV